MLATRRFRILLSLLSGVLLAISFPFTGSLTPLIFVALVPLLIVEDYVFKSVYRSSKVFLHAYITFLIFNIGTTWWIWNASPGGALMAFTLNALIMTSAFLFFHLLKKCLGTNYAGLILLAIWIGFEFLHHRWELSWPWLSLGNVFSIRPSWIQWYEFTGISGGTLWILLVNYLGFLIIRPYLSKQGETQRNRKPLYVLILSVSIPLMISIYIGHVYREVKNPVEVVAVQPNIDPYNEKFSLPVKPQLEKIIALAEKMRTPNTSLILAPETALSSTFFEEDLKRYDFFDLLLNRLRKWKNTSFFTGASTARFFKAPHSRASLKLTDGPGYIEYYNSSLIMKPNADHTFLHKSKLVLGVEKVPFSDWIPFLEELSIKNGGTSGTLGTESSPKTLSCPKITFSPLICYESIYGEFCAEQCRKGAEAIMVITNDGWWGNTPGYKQHMSFSRLRAIENRRSVVRSANTGISCFIDQKGNVIKASEWWVATALRGNLNKNSQLTFFSKTGDLIGKAFLYLGIAFLIYGFIKWLKKLWLLRFNS